MLTFLFLRPHFSSRSISHFSRPKRSFSKDTRYFFAIGLIFKTLAATFKNQSQGHFFINRTFTFCWSLSHLFGHAFFTFWRSTPLIYQNKPQTESRYTFKRSGTLFTFTQPRKKPPSNTPKTTYTPKSIINSLTSL